MNFKLFCILGLSAIVFFKATAQNLPLDQAVRMGHLANGFTYFIRHNHEPAHMVTMYLVNKAGSILEDDDQRGLAHFMEHMSFNGTRHFPKNELVNYLQKSGVRFGADLNAYTNFDETVYQLPLPTDRPEILQNGIQIMRDWAQDALLDPAEINKERGVVLEEKRLGKGAQERMQRQYLPRLLNNSRYALRLPIGIDEVLNNFKPEAIKRFYKDWYRPDLQALIVVGDIDVAEMERVIKAKFSDLKNPVNRKLRIKYAVPLIDKNQFIALTDPEMTTTQMELMIDHPQPSLKTQADFCKAITRSLFNQMLAGRFAELLRQADPPFVQGSSRISGFIGGLDSYDANVMAKPGELERGFKAVIRETERVKRFGFTQTELDRAKKSYVIQMESALKEKDKTSSESFVKEYQQYFLNDIAAPGIETEYQLVQQYLPTITLRDMKLLSGEYTGGRNRAVLLMAPQKDKASLPDEATVNNWIMAISAENLQPYQDEVSSKPLLAKQPVSGTIVTELKDENSGITIFKLNNGVKVVVKPTQFKNDQILFSAFSPGGTSLYSDADFQSASNANGLVSAGGAGNYSATELNKFLSGKQVGVGTYISERSQGLSGSSTPGDLETALSLIYARLTEPRKDTVAFSGLIARSKAMLANRANDPNSVFQDTISALAGNYNSRRTGPTLAKLDQIRLNRAYAIYRERFSDASDMTFVFVGSFDMETARPLLARYLGALPATYKSEKATDLGIHIPYGKIEKIVYKGTEQKATVNLMFSGLFNLSAQSRILLDALKETLEIRLLERLREDESGVYSPGVSASISKFPQARYSFVIQFGCAPQNVDKLIASTLDEVNKLKTYGPPQVNVDKYKAETERQMETQLKTNSFWLNYLNGQLQNQDDLHQIDNYQSTINMVAIESIKKTAQLYLSGDNFIRLVLMPESTEKSK